MGRESRETWAKRVQRWRDSGLTAKEYAAELGVNAHSLTWWKWRLTSRGASASPSRVGRPRRAPTVGPLTFVEVPATPAAESIEIVLPSSVRIRVPTAFDASTLSHVLDVLEQRR